MSRRKLFFKMLARSLFRRRSRMVAAFLAIAIGATVLAGMATICLDIPRQLAREFRSYGANLVLVPAGDLGVMEMNAVEEIADLLPPDQLIGVTPYRYEAISVNRQPCTATGIRFAQVSKTSPYWDIDGSIPERADEIVIGAELAEFTGLAANTQVRLSGRNSTGQHFSQDVTIAGVLRTGGVEEEGVFMELSTLENLFGNPGQVNLVEVSIAVNGDELQTIADEIAGQIASVSPRLVGRVARSEATVLAKLQFLLFLVGAIMMALTLIGVATTMMIVVMERRKEIGLKKALGAESRSIMTDFFAEAMSLGVLGGVIGAICGFLFALITGSSVFQRTVSFDWIATVGTIIIAVLVAVVACVLPVKRAAEVEPALVLRGE